MNEAKDLRNRGDELYEAASTFKEEAQRFLAKAAEAEHKAIVFWTKAEIIDAIESKMGAKQ